MLKNALNFFEKIKNDIIESILDILFPPVCGICGKKNRNWLCSDCRNKLKRWERFQFVNLNSSKNIKRKNHFLKVKIHIQKGEMKLEKKHIYYDCFLYIFDYKSMIRKLILRYKFRKEAYLYHLFSKIILNDKKTCRILSFYDIIIPVPMDQKKKQQRGYNQTELIAKELSQNLGIPMDLNVLKKVKITKTQSTLSEKERATNIKNAFQVNTKYSLKNKKVIIFDDIYTTGATVNEISRVLKESDVKEILVLVLAKD